jgi:hypothetical protein
MAYLNLYKILPEACKILDEAYAEHGKEMVSEIDLLMEKLPELANTNQARILLASVKIERALGNI